MDREFLDAEIRLLKIKVDQYKAGEAEEVCSLHATGRTVPAALQPYSPTALTAYKPKSLPLKLKVATTLAACLCV